MTKSTLPSELSSRAEPSRRFCKDHPSGSKTPLSSLHDMARTWNVNPSDPNGPVLGVPQGSECCHFLQEPSHVVSRLRSARLGLAPLGKWGRQPRRRHAFWRLLDVLYPRRRRCLFLDDEKKFPVDSEWVGVIKGDAVVSENCRNEGNAAYSITVSLSREPTGRNGLGTYRVLIFSTERSILRWRSLRHRSHKGMKPANSSRVCASYSTSGALKTVLKWLHYSDITNPFYSINALPPQPSSSSLSISQTIWQPSVCATFALRAQDFSSFAVVVNRSGRRPRSRYAPFVQNVRNFLMIWQLATLPDTTGLALWPKTWAAFRISHIRAGLMGGPPMRRAIQ
ncbi:hypothetical protein BJV77DRAFT_1152907 [Russula vinacea]|nr:hypothetical protein BJV77DRAFT_1152907 [Russula vinacea]